MLTASMLGARVLALGKLRVDASPSKDQHDVRDHRTQQRWQSTLQHYGQRCVARPNNGVATSAGATDTDSLCVARRTLVLRASHACLLRMAIYNFAHTSPLPTQFTNYGLRNNMGHAQITSRYKPSTATVYKVLVAI